MPQAVPDATLVCGTRPRVRLCVVCGVCGVCGSGDNGIMAPRRQAGGGNQLTELKDLKPLLSTHPSPAHGTALEVPLILDAVREDKPAMALHAAIHKAALVHRPALEHDFAIPVELGGGGILIREAVACLDDQDLGTSKGAPGLIEGY